jgi:uncharacterized protein YndB with AHSA1/START domain
MNKTLHLSTQITCDTNEAFRMFTVNEMLESWLTVAADVEAKLGGKYELFWDPDNKENNSTIGCRITAIEKDKFIAFEWKGPTQFKDFMNNIVPLTHVVVFFIPYRESNEQGTEIHLIHSGWGESSEWEEARIWFDKAWQAAFDRLQKLVNVP